MFVRYPYTGNFFNDGSTDALRRMADAISLPSVNAVARFLADAGFSLQTSQTNRTVAQVVKDLLGIQV